MTLFRLQGDGKVLLRAGELKLSRYRTAIRVKGIEILTYEALENSGWLLKEDELQLLFQ